MKNRHWLLIGIVIIALFLRTYHLKELPPGLYPDEAMDGNNALHALHAGEWSVFYPENNGREGLFMNIQAVFIKFLGGEVWVLRLPSTLFGIFTVIGLYFLTRELLRVSKKFSDSDGAAIALLSAYFLATSFWHINFSRISFRAISSPFFMVWALYLLFLGYRKMRDDSAKRLSAWHLLGGVVFGLGMYTYIAYRTMPAVIGIIFIYFFLIAKREGWLRKFFCTSASYAALAFATAIPLLYYFAVHPGSFFGRTSQVSVAAGGHTFRDLLFNTVKTAGMFDFVGDFNWRQNFAGRPELFWPVGICFIVGICLALKKLFARNDAGGNFLKRLFSENNLPYAMLFSFGIFAALPVVISNEGIPHALRSILIIPPVFILAGLGSYKIYRWLTSLSRSPWIPRALAVILVLLFVEAYTAYFVIWGKNPNVQGAFAADYAKLGNELNSLPTATPKYVVVRAGGVLVNGIPMPAQTVMYITDTWDAKQQQEKNIHYVLPEDEAVIPSSSLKFYIQ